MLGAEDLWTHFKDCYERGDIPSLEELYDLAIILWDNYSNPGAFTRFVLGGQPNNSVVPIGEPWGKDEDPEPRPAPKRAMGNDVKGEGGEKLVKGEGKEEMKGKDESSSAEVKEFQGDRVLARSAAFMYEALVSKEVAQAVAEGDIGRVYEGIKVSV